VVVATLGPGRYSLAYQIFGPYLFHPGWHGLFGSLLLGIGGALGQLALFYRPPVKQAS
jgi:putative oxidoreductase